MIADNNNIFDENDDPKKTERLSERMPDQPFEPGDDYFGDFVLNLQNHIDDFEEIKADAPVLSAIPKYNPFVVPPGYFDELPSYMQQRIAISKPFGSFMDTLLLIIKPRFAVPFLITALIAFAGINFMNKHAEMQKSGVPEETSVEEQLYGIDESVIIEKLYPPENIVKDTISMDENSIESYLIENNVDETTLN